MAISKIYVFVLISQKTGRYFFGQTIDLRRTLMAYNLGNSEFKMKYAPVALLASKKFDNRTDATKVEQELRKKQSEDEIILYLFYNDFQIHDDRK